MRLFIYLALQLGICATDLQNDKRISNVRERKVIRERSVKLHLNVPL